MPVRPLFAITESGWTGADQKFQIRNSKFENQKS